MLDIRIFFTIEADNNLKVHVFMAISQSKVKNWKIINF